MSQIRTQPDAPGTEPSSARPAIDDLIEVMTALRTPVTGCPWDLEQTFATIAPYTIEEAYEVADAIERNDMVDLQDELGDLLLQVVYHSQMAREAGHFSFEDVARSVTEKMIRRHPHVFGEAHAKTAGAVKGMWEAIKATERAAKADVVPAPGARGASEVRGDARVAVTPGVLDDVPRALPALMRAGKLQKRAARVGFDWPDTTPVYAKIREELGELESAAASGDTNHIREELGDLLFVMANLARHYGIEPEDALGQANAKFIRRFRFIERQLAADGRTPEVSNLEEMDRLWDAAKAEEKPPTQAQSQAGK